MARCLLYLAKTKRYASSIQDQESLFRFTCIFHSIQCNLIMMSRVPSGHGKSWNLGRPFSRPGKSWKIAKVMEKSWKMMIMSWNLYYCTEQFCKSDSTSFIKSNYEPLYLFNNGTMSRWNCHY